MLYVIFEKKVTNNLFYALKEVIKCDYMRVRYVFSLIFDEKL